MNDGPGELEAVADFISGLETSKSYISAPIRPPAEDWVLPPSEGRIVEAHSIFLEKGIETELLIEPEGDQFTSVDDLESDVLGITAVHPLREEHLKKLVARSGSTWEVIDDLLHKGALKRIEYEGQVFYLKSL